MFIGGPFEKILCSVLLNSDSSNLQAYMDDNLQMVACLTQLIFLQAVFNQKVKYHTVVNAVPFLLL